MSWAPPSSGGSAAGSDTRSGGEYGSMIVGWHILSRVDWGIDCWEDTPVAFPWRCNLYLRRSSWSSTPCCQVVADSFCLEGDAASCSSDSSWKVARRRESWRESSWWRERRRCWASARWAARYSERVSLPVAWGWKGLGFSRVKGFITKVYYQL